MEDTFAPQDLSCYALFDEKCPQTAEDIIESIRGENHFLPLYAYERVADIPDLRGLLSALATYYVSLCKVCKKPYSHLKTAHEVLRIDKVKKIGYEAISYLASHPEDWQAKQASGLKPARLLCITSEIDYGVYENKVTKKLIDDIIVVLSAQKKELETKKDQMQEMDKGLDTYTNESVFGWDRAFYDAMWNIFLQGTDKEKGLQDNKKRLGKVEDYLQRITDFLKKYRHLRMSLLYRRAGDTKNISRQMHKTNLFCFDKNYNAVLKLWDSVKKFNQTKKIKNNTGRVQQDIENFPKNYRRFCYASVLYALSKMGFEKQHQTDQWGRGDDIQVAVTEQKDRIAVSFYDVTPYRMPMPGRVVFPSNHCAFKKENGDLVWPKDITQEQLAAFLWANRNINRELSGEINKAMAQHRAEKSIYFIPYPRKVGENNEYKVIQELISVKPAENEYFVFPLSEQGEKKLTRYRPNGGNNLVCFSVSLFDVNSYRRLQKIFLKTLTELRVPSVYCPLCGEKLGPERNNVRKCTNPQCELCLTRTRCESCKQAYIYLRYDINEHYIHSVPMQWMQRDSQFRYVDIVALEIKPNPARISPVCPHCEKD